MTAKIYPLIFSDKNGILDAQELLDVANLANEYNSPIALSLPEHLKVLDDFPMPKIKVFKNGNQYLIGINASKMIKFILENKQCPQ